MSKRIHTIQSSDKKEFDKEVNFFLELGCELHDGGYEVIKKDNETVYSQVVVFDTNKYVVKFYENGRIEQLGSLNKDGIVDGLWTWWQDNGQKSWELPFKDGKEDGLSTSWRKKGQKSSEVNYKDGKKNGLMTFWYENGQKKYERTYKDGKQEGIETWWYENGQKNSEYTFKDGKLIFSKNWFSDGSVWE